MLLVGTIALLLGYFVARWGIRIMKDPDQPIDAGGIRILFGAAVFLTGAGMCAIELVSRLVG